MLALVVAPRSVNILVTQHSADMLRLAVIVGFVLVCADAVQELDGSTTCKDNPYFADCHLIVRSKFCSHSYYSRFCCKSCVEAGQLDARELQWQADDILYRN